MCVCVCEQSGASGDGTNSFPIDLNTYILGNTTPFLCIATTLDYMFYKLVDPKLKQTKKNNIICCIHVHGYSNYDLTFSAYCLGLFAYMYQHIFGMPEGCLDTAVVIVCKRLNEHHILKCCAKVQVFKNITQEMGNTFGTEILSAIADE